MIFLTFLCLTTMVSVDKSAESESVIDSFKLGRLFYAVLTCFAILGCMLEIDDELDSLGFKGG